MTDETPVPFFARGEGYDSEYDSVGNFVMARRYVEGILPRHLAKELVASGPARLEHNGLDQATVTVTVEITFTATDVL